MIMQLIINFHELFLVNKRNHTSHLKKKTCSYHKDKFVNVRAIYNPVLPCSNLTFFGIKEVISSSSFSMHGSLLIYTHFTSP